ncbi:PDR/VanB family oxidoreductase [Psychromonas sp. 14N.309.X.WAT.B.A12]|uniref:PDR/VanB family oxidoreductase n=1 Tax=Psychromonas sp. 14N.309.X.WAT.B.A12 TaxID=2998322 RepID=UPI0025AF3291|nr:PDR/VanB family oxidoreductase [Psychromonas sp. 14N.309.X.WAT.B.A12]MDN2664511.1 PDR/VanB family oxidoreductase [Psychromonas sp. 14N.309.X.WAT.B.A12]
MIEDKKIQVRISEIEVLTETICRYRFESLNKESLPAFSAGAHIEVDINDDFTRAYSLCSDPSDAHTYYDIAVKREELGRGGSKAFHQVAKVGGVFSISTPKNYFSLSDTAEHHLLIGAGIGLTPMIAMAHTLTAEHKDFTFIACASGLAGLPFSSQLSSRSWSTQLWLAGRASFHFADLLVNLPKQVHVYCCGPNGFLELVKEQCLASTSEPLPTEQWHEERFTATGVSANSDSFELYLRQSEQRISVATGESMVEALHKAGIKVDTVCEQGICGSCLVAWSDGEPIHRDQCLEDTERDEYIALCCGGCNSQSLTLEL